VLIVGLVLIRKYLVGRRTATTVTAVPVVIAAPGLGSVTSTSTTTDATPVGLEMKAAGELSLAVDDVSKI
jgi:hypothetical protein